MADNAKKTDDEHAPNEESDRRDNKHGNEDDGPSPEPAGDTNFSQRIDRTWVDVHSLTPRTDPGLFIPGMPTGYAVDDEGAIGTKRSHPGEDEDDPDPPSPGAPPRGNSMFGMAI